MPSLALGSLKSYGLALKFKFVMSGIQTEICGLVSGSENPSPLTLMLFNDSRRLPVRFGPVIMPPMPPEVIAAIRSLKYIRLELLDWLCNERLTVNGEDEKPFGPE